MTERQDAVTTSDELLRRYLPEQFLCRLPAEGAHWRGRMILLLWSLGYHLEHAWWLGMNVSGDPARAFERQIGRLDDDRLIAQLNATVEARGDDSHLEFVSFGLLRRARNG